MLWNSTALGAYQQPRGVRAVLASPHRRRAGLVAMMAVMLIILLRVMASQADFSPQAPIDSVIWSVVAGQTLL